MGGAIAIGVSKTPNKYYWTPPQVPQYPTPLHHNIVESNHYRNTNKQSNGLIFPLTTVVVMDRDATINSKWKKQVLFGGFDIIKVLEAIAFAISRGV